MNSGPRFRPARCRGHRGVPAAEALPANRSAVRSTISCKWLVPTWLWPVKNAGDISTEPARRVAALRSLPSAGRTPCPAFQEQDKKQASAARRQKAPGFAVSDAHKPPAQIPPATFCNVLQRLRTITVVPCLAGCCNVLSDRTALKRGERGFRLRTFDLDDNRELFPREPSQFVQVREPE